MRARRTRPPTTSRWCWCPTARRCARPTTLELAAALGLRTTRRAAAVRRLHRRRRAGRPGRRGLRRVGGAQHRRRRAGGARRPGRAERGDRELPGLPEGADRLRPHPARASRRPTRFGAEMVLARDVVGLEARGPVRAVCLEGAGEVEARALIVATGVSYRRLEAPGVDALTGRGVYYGANASEAAQCAGRRRVRRRGRQLRRAGGPQPRPLRRAGRAAWSAAPALDDDDVAVPRRADPTPPRPSRCGCAPRWSRPAATGTWSR